MLRPAARPEDTSWRYALALLFLAGLGWRVAYLGRLAQSPLGGSLTEDARIYWDWAGFLVRHGGWGKHPFFLGPLYPYVLWPLRALFGDATGPVLVVQSLWGAVSSVLLADAARRLTRPSIGILAGLIAAFYQTAVFFDGLVLMESLLFFLESLLLWWVIRRAAPRPDWALAIAGTLIGLLTDGRATSAFLLAPAWLFLVRGATAPRAMLRSSIALLAGFMLAVTPFAVRNVVVSREWIPFTYNLGFNLYVGNNPDANGAYVSITGSHGVGASIATGEDGGGEADGRAYLRSARGLDLGPGASSAWWTRAAAAYASSHPGRTLALLARKATMLWNAREIPQVENVREYRDVAGPLGLPVAGTFACIGPLALAGMVVSRRRDAALRFLVGYAVVMTIVILPFFVTGRYRHHLVPCVVLLAGLALERAIDAWTRQDLRTGGRWLASLAVGLLITQLPVPALSEGKYAWGLAMDLGTRWAERGRPDLAAAAYERAIAMEARGALGQAHGPSADNERADLYYDYANALVRLGREGEALTWYRRAVERAPHHPLAVRALAGLERRSGNTAYADSLDRASGGDRTSTDLDRGWTAAREGRWNDAERAFEDAARAHPESGVAWGALIRIQVQTGHADRARATLDRAVTAGLPRAEADLYGALLAALRGDRGGARTLLERVPQRAIDADPTLADVARVVRQRIESP